MSTKISWTNETWNPVVGCTKVSAGCKICYAEKMAFRLIADAVTKNVNPYVLMIMDGETGTA